MIKRPFIFLTQDYGKMISDGSGTDLSGQLSNINIQSFPYELTFFFTDRWGNITNRKVDTLILQDTTLVNATISAADSSGNYNTLFTVSGNSDNTFMLKAQQAVTTSSVRITINADGNPGTVTVGRLMLFGYICDLFALTDATFKKDTNQGSYRLVSGDIVYYGDYDKLTTKLKTENLPQAQFKDITDVVDESNQLTMLPFYDDEIGGIYECYADPEYSFSLDRKTGLYALDLELKQL